MHIVIQKEFEEIDVCIPCSHWFAERSEALRWMFARQMQNECYIVSKSKFIMLGGYFNKGTI